MLRLSFITRIKTMLAKWRANAPYYLFYNKLARIAETYTQPNAISFTDLLCPTLGKIESSLHITNCADVNWLMHKYTVMELDTTPITIIYGRLADSNDLETIKRDFPLVTIKEVELGPNRLHNTKMSIFKYTDDSVRIVVSTADLRNEDWTTYNNGIWISPACPKLSDDAFTNGESATMFKSRLAYYLSGYRMGIMHPFLTAVENANFKNIKVFLISSIPGCHPSGRHNHITVMSNLLKRYCRIPIIDGCSQENTWAIIGQSPVIGELGYEEEVWLESFITSLSEHKRYMDSSLNAHFDFIHPTQKNRDDTFGYDFSTSYSMLQHLEQEWFEDHMKQWNSDKLHRSRAMPRIKCYTRISPCHTRLVYYLLTSADLTQNAWGYYINSPKVHIGNFEVGILFMPQLFGEDFFELTETTKNRKIFPLIYDVGLKRYEEEDRPWFE